MSDPPVPLRTEVTVLGPDDPNQKKIGFVVREYEGCELHPLTEDGHVDKTKTFKEDELQVGMRVAFASLFGGTTSSRSRRPRRGSSAASTMASTPS